MEIRKRSNGEICFSKTNKRVIGVYCNHTLYTMSDNLNDTVLLEKYKAQLKKRDKKYSVNADPIDFMIALIGISDDVDNKLHIV